LYFTLVTDVHHFALQYFRSVNESVKRNTFIYRHMLQMNQRLRYNDVHQTSAVIFSHLPSLSFVSWVVIWQVADDLMQTAVDLRCHRTCVHVLSFSVYLKYSACRVMWICSATEVW